MNPPDYLEIPQETLDVFRQALEISLAVENLSPKNKDIAVSILMGSDWPVYDEVDHLGHAYGKYAMYVFLPTRYEIESKKPTDTRDGFMKNAVNILTFFINKHKNLKHESS